MSECKNINDKYLRFLESGVQILIERAGVTHKEILTYRRNGGMKKTLSKARTRRDEIYRELFGGNVTLRFYHIKKRSGSTDSDLPPGISIGLSRGIPLYVVASWIGPNGLVSRKRFNIKKLGRDTAIELAVEFRDTKTQELQ